MIIHSGTSYHKACDYILSCKRSHKQNFPLHHWIHLQLCSRLMTYTSMLSLSLETSHLYSPVSPGDTCVVPHPCRTYVPFSPSQDICNLPPSLHVDTCVVPYLRGTCICSSLPRTHVFLPSLLRTHVLSLTLVVHMCPSPPPRTHVFLPSLLRTHVLSFTLVVHCVLLPLPGHMYFSPLS